MKMKYFLLPSTVGNKVLENKVVEVFEYLNILLAKSYIKVECSLFGQKKLFFDFSFSDNFFVWIISY